MSNDNFVYWDLMKDVPQKAQTPITGGRLKGKTDIKPQWRLQIMTEVFGPIGIGWNYKVTDRWTEDFSGEVSAHVMIELVYRKPGTEEWSLPIPGQGGSMLVAKEKTGNYHSDEAFKMATTDALSVAMKQIGVAANIYMGKKGSDPTSKYNERPAAASPAVKMITDVQMGLLRDVCAAMEASGDLEGEKKLSLELDTGMTESRAAMLVRQLT